MKSAITIFCRVSVQILYPAQLLQQWHLILSDTTVHSVRWVRSGIRVSKLIPRNVPYANECRIVQPTDILSRGLLKGDRKNAKTNKQTKNLYFSLSFVFVFNVICSITSIICIFLCFFFVHFPPFIHLAQFSGIISYHNRDYQPPLDG